MSMMPAIPSAPDADPKPQGRIAVVIVNYGTADLTTAGIESVLAHDHGGRPLELHVVDNASPGEDGTILAARHAERGWGDRVILWQETINHGFGRGNNLVIDALKRRPDPPQYVFLLNPDAALENEVLAILANRLDATPQAAAAGAGIALPTGQPVTAAFRFPSAQSEFAQAINFGPVTRFFGSRLVPLPPDHPDGQVDWVSGAAVLFRFSVLCELGGFDPDFFLYYEEVELMSRIRRAGYQVIYVPAARICHAEGAATDVKSGQSERRSRPAYWYNSWRIYYLKTAGRSGAIAAGLSWMMGAALNVPLARLRGQPLRAPKGFFCDFPRLVLKPLLLGRAE